MRPVQALKTGGRTDGYHALIPALIDQNSWAHFRRPIEVIRYG